MKFIYSGKVLETKEMIEEGRESYTINALYRHSRGFYWKINRMGYVHVIMPVKMALNGEFSHYEIQDSLLTKDNIVPVSKGGKNTIENYQTMCKKCNVEKGNRMP